MSATVPPPAEDTPAAEFITSRTALYRARGLSPADALDAARDAQDAGRPVLAQRYREVAARMAAEATEDAEDAEDAVRPARVCRFVAGWAVLVLLATLVSVAVNVGPGVTALLDYATHAATAPVAAVQVPAPACGGDAECEGLDEAQQGTQPAVGAVGDEDGPGWSCQLDGNRRCGPGASGG